MAKTPKKVTSGIDCAFPKDLPKYEVLQADARRFGSGDPSDVLVVLSLLGAARDVGRMKETHFARYGLSDGRFFVLMQLRRMREDGGAAMTPADIADRAGVSRATMTGLLDGLEKDGLVSRTPRSDDRRMIDIHITDHALKLLERTLPDHYARLEKAFASVSKPEKETLTRLLTKVREAVAGLDPEDAED